MKLDNFYLKLWNIKDSIKEDIKKLGDKVQYITPIGFLAYVACFGTHQLGIIFCVTFIISMIILSLLNALFNNPRPREVEGTENPDLNLDWSPSDGNSFPSGHTMSAMMGGVFWFQIGLLPGILGVLLGAFTGISRVIARAHWLRDILTSSIVSVLLYLIVVIFIL